MARVAVIGIGNLGSALLSYKDFLKQNYKSVAAFEIDPSGVIGRVSEKLGKPVEVLHVNRLKQVAKERKIEIGIITTPAEQAQNVVNMLVEAEVKRILNFAPKGVRIMNYQRLVLVGNAVSAPERKTSKKGDVAYTTLQVAVSDARDRTTYFPVAVFGQQAEVVASHVSKGRQVLVEGRSEVAENGHFNVVADRVVLGVAVAKSDEDE